MSGERPAGRALAVDLGSRRVGLAVSDRNGRLALPYDVLERGPDLAADAAAIAAALEETGATTVVVGLPLSLDGSEGPAAREVRAWADALARALPWVAVVLADERLTTVSATSALAGAGRRGARARHRVDSSAAAVLLQSWLDRAGRPA